MNLRRRRAVNEKKGEGDEDEELVDEAKNRENYAKKTEGMALKSCTSIYEGPREFCCRKLGKMDIKICSLKRMGIIASRKIAALPLSLANDIILSIYLHRK
jgi:hypothetical protein